VYALNLRADKILVTTVERVHYHKDLGVAEITAESSKEFCRRWYPEKYDNITESFMHNESSYYLDFEETLSGLENAAKYSSLILAAKLGTLASVEHKGFLICTLIIHAMRSYEFMSTTIARMRSEGVEKWEYFWLLRNAWGTSDFLARAVLAPALGEWTGRPALRFTCDV
jgi:hypothetical protein